MIYTRLTGKPNFPISTPFLRKNCMSATLSCQSYIPQIPRKTHANADGERFSGKVNPYKS